MSETTKFKKKCPCGKGFVQWERYEAYSSWSSKHDDEYPTEILCEYCKKTHELKRFSGSDRKSGDEYSYISVEKKK